MQFTPQLSESQTSWFLAQKYEVLHLLARGKSAGVWLVERNGKKFAAKCEHAKSYRTQMLEREALQLKMANQIGIGPRFVDSDLGARVIVMEWVDGKTLRDFITGSKSKSQLLRVVKSAFVQAEKLDAAGIDHGQLGGKLANMLVDNKGNVVVIDFEKASYVRKTHNVSQLRHAFLGGKTELSKKILRLVGKELEKAGRIPHLRSAPGLR